MSASNTIQWPENYNIGHSIDTEDGKWMADLILVDTEKEEDVAIHYLGNEFESERDAENAVLEAEKLTEEQLRQLDWVTA